MDPGVIKRLDECVVNRIAAGEVIQRPANALKELIENSLDAKSTSIQVTVKTGGLKYLQASQGKEDSFIVDNGTGIRKADLEIVCERFTTSKLEHFEDLSTIRTYGFRGEALASISHVARLTIQTKTAQEKCGFRATYSDGKLVGTPKPCAGNQGTQIIVEDLFYNVPLRKQALKQPNEEFQKILDVVGKYSVHNAGVGFGLKKMGEKDSLRTQYNSTHSKNIAAIYGSDIAKELLEIEFDDSVLQISVKCLITNVNYSSKKGTFILFINHRLVESVALKQSIDQIYATYLAKGTHPFLYVSLEIAASSVDVNVHPTKHEVHFLHEEEILSKISQEIEKKLLGSNASRSFYTQTLLPGASNPVDNVEEEKSSQDIKYAKHMVRTDPKSQKLEKFFGNTTKDKSLVNDSQTQNTSKSKLNLIKPIRLKIIVRLKNEIERNCNFQLKVLLNSLTYVGCIDAERAIIQHETKMYLCNTKKLSEEIFYQILIFDFGNFGKIEYDPPLPLRDLIILALRQVQLELESDDNVMEVMAESLLQTIMIKADALKSYYNLIIEDGKLYSLPLLIGKANVEVSSPKVYSNKPKFFVPEKHKPSLSFLPNYILSLASDVDLTDEENFYKTFSRKTAEYYSEIAKTTSESDWKWCVEHVIYPALKNHFMPPQHFATNKAFLEIASLPNLYKVFERC
ncbi:hypothetical protein HA402_011359 [Bradysia odoriphaga]|nr:hypothetical protein HA402_011359 [Bradysia odoriphaga]